MVFAVTDASDVIITFIASLPAIITAVVMIGRKMRKMDANVSDIKSDIQTNHGKKPYEYLEMIADIHSGLVDNKLDIIETKHLIAKQAELMDEHLAQDAVNFTEIKSMFRKLTEEND